MPDQRPLSNDVPRGMTPPTAGRPVGSGGVRNGDHAAANAAWEAEDGTDWDEENFRRHILPRLQGVPLSSIMEVTGLSVWHCSLVRRGDVVPHPRHWAALRTLAEKPA